MRIGLFLGAAALALATPAAAAWQQASSKHFIIYGDMPAAEMRDYATKLEKFDAAARLVRSMKDPVVGDGNRVQVFVVSSMLDVNRLYGRADAGVGGYYVGQVTGPFIVTPQKIRRLNTRANRIDPEVVFFHEYTHHLMLQTTNKPMPSWLTEGFAEFLGNPVFGEDGSVGIGAPAEDRAEALLQRRWAPIADLLEGNAYTLGYAGFAGQNYAQGWLLNHYLNFEPSRKGQIDKYVDGIGRGQNALDAAKAAFGDLGVLENQLRSYVRQKSLPFLKIDSSKLTIAPVTISELPPGAQEVMPLRIHAKTSYRALSIDSVLSKVRDIAKRHPGDVLVLRTLAEVELDAKNWNESLAAAEAALKLDPKSTEALIYKGRAYLAQAKKQKDAKLFAEARRQFLAANRLDPEDPEALYLYYRTYRTAGVPVPKQALEALHYATILAPRDYYPALQLVTEHLRQNNLKAASDALKPLAYLPHAGQSTRNDALRVLALIDAGKGPEALALAQKELFPKKDEDPN